jgi:hypothetical protein
MFLCPKPARSAGQTRARIADVEICQALTLARRNMSRPMEGHLRVNTMFISHNVRKAVNEGRADFTPVLLSEFTLLFKNGLLPIDVAMIHVSPPDEHGFCSLGVEVGLTKSPAESAKIVIAEVNEQMPRTLGDSFIHVSRLTHIVPGQLSDFRTAHGRRRRPGSGRENGRSHCRTDPRRRDHANGHRRSARCGAEIPVRQKRPWHSHRTIFRRRDRPGRSGRADQRPQNHPPGKIVPGSSSAPSDCTIGSTTTR